MIFQLSNEYSKTYVLRENYSEYLFLVNNSGGEIWAEYTVNLSPKEEMTIDVQLIDKAEKHQDYFKSFEVGISNSIKRLLDKLNDKGIGLTGMNLKVTNLSYHPVDTKPLGYEILFLEMMNRLFNTSTFEMKINDKITENKFYDIFEIVNPFLYNYDFTKYPNYNFVIPKRFANTIVLNQSHEVIIYELVSSIPRWKITISPYYKLNVIYRINILYDDKFQDNRKYPQEIFLIETINQIKKTINELALLSFNVATLYFLIEPLYDSYEVPDESNIDLLKWALLTILLDPNKTHIHKENITTLVS